MKLIIDVAEKYYEACKDAVEKPYPSQIEEVIANGTPLPKGHGRLIDADKLKEKVTKLRDLAKKREEDTPVNSPCYRTYLAQANERHGFIGMIDDAPTIELSPVINMKPITAEEKQGLINALKKSGLKMVKLDDEKIQGEWARHDEWVNGEYVGGFYHVNCPVIEEGYALYSRWETRFCPNCGAPMKIGGDNA